MSGVEVLGIVSTVVSVTSIVSSAIRSIQRITAQRDLIQLSVNNDELDVVLDQVKSLLLALETTPPWPASLPSLIELKEQIQRILEELDSLRSETKPISKWKPWRRESKDSKQRKKAIYRYLVSCRDNLNSLLSISLVVEASRRADVEAVGSQESRRPIGDHDAHVHENLSDGARNDDSIIIQDPGPDVVPDVHLTPANPQSASTSSEDVHLSRVPLWRCICWHMYICIGSFSSVSLGFGIIWSVWKKDMSSGFTVGSYILALGAFFVLILSGKHNENCLERDKLERKLLSDAAEARRQVQIDLDSVEHR